MDLHFLRAPKACQSGCAALLGPPEPVKLAVQAFRSGCAALLSPQSLSNLSWPLSIWIRAPFKLALNPPGPAIGLELRKRPREPRARAKEGAQGASG